MSELFKLDLQYFADLTTDVPSPINKTSDSALSAEMKTFYDTQLLENSRALLYYKQFAKKQPLPKNSGKTVEWRKFATYAPATTPLTEGVTPTGKSVGVTKITATIEQYGDYTAISDRLEVEAVDPIIMGVTEEHGAQAGETLDVVCRDEIMTGTNVIYAGGKTSRAALTKTDVLTPTLINQAVTLLKKNKAKPVDGGNYVCILHPSQTYDIRQSDEWVDAHKYASPDEIYNGEIGKLHNCRFVETTQSKVWQGTGDNCAANTAVYGAIVFGKDAWGSVDPTAESMEVIVKTIGSAGTADPLNQRSSVGFKVSTADKILYQERLVRLETGSFYSDVDDAN